MPLVTRRPPQQFVPQMMMSPLPPQASWATQWVSTDGIRRKVAYDYRTIMIPHTVTETYSKMETRLVDIKVRLGGTVEDGGAQNSVHVPLQVLISFPTYFQKQKTVAVPRKVSIPRPVVEKRVVTKMVPKVIQVEEQYEIEAAVTEKTPSVRLAYPALRDRGRPFPEWSDKERPSFGLPFPSLPFNMSDLQRYR